MTDGVFTALCLSETVKVGEGRGILWENDFLFKEHV
jgi:hypothetical protein